MNDSLLVFRLLHLHDVIAVLFANFVTSPVKAASASWNNATTPEGVVDAPDTNRSLIQENATSRTTSKFLNLEEVVLQLVELFSCLLFPSSCSLLHRDILLGLAMPVQQI